MQLEPNYNDESRKRSMNRMTVQAPGYVSTASWNYTPAAETGPSIIQKGRAVTPPPSCFVGLHRLSLEAFWQD